MGTCEKRARWWLATCACALAACGVGVSAHCTSPFVCPDTDACSKENDTVFYVEGRRYPISFNKCDYLNMSCDVSLDSKALPHISSLLSFQNVTLHNCPPPRTYASYRAALEARNIQATISFRLVNLPANTIITAASLDQLPPILEIHAVGGTLVVEPGALVNLDGVNKVNLSRVQFDQIDPRLTDLEIRDYGYERLPPSLLKNMHGKVKIVDNALEVIDMASLELRVLKLETPILEKLRLRNISVNLMPAGFLDGCPQLSYLKLSELREDWLQRGLLRGAVRLDTFLLVENRFTTLPVDLFSFSPNLDMIDLSNNKLKYLPKAIFFGLKNLKHLLLNNNQLTASSLPNIGSLTSLRDLKLSKNPLGDLCPPGGESLLWTLWQLEALQLASTNITRICQDWFSDMTRLREVELWHNSISSLSCSELPIIRDSIYIVSFIVLINNQIRKINCSQEEYELAARNPKPEQRVVLWVDPILPCTCDTFWLLQTMYRRRVKVHGLQHYVDNPKHGNATCVDEDLQCKPIQLSERD